MWLLQDVCTKNIKIMCMLKNSNLYPSLTNNSNYFTPDVSSSQDYSSESSQSIYPDQPSTSQSYNARTTGIEDKINEMTLRIPRTTDSKNKCIVCGERKKLINIPSKAFLDTFITSNILIPRDGKCCAKHLNKNNTLLKNSLNNLEIVSENTVMSNEEIEMLLSNLRQASKFTLFEKFSKRKNITEDECKRFTGLTKGQFNDILSSLSTLKPSLARTQSQALATYLFWLKTGLDDRTIATLFSIDNHQAISTYKKQVRTTLLKDFVPQNLGVNHLSREDWLKTNTIMAKTLLDVQDDKMIFVADGTYLYHNKSKDNELQRQSYSVQKSRHLAKPFVICATNGRIIDIYGLFPATQNDATIIKTIFKSNKDLRKFIQPDDHIVLNRGFRNVVNHLQTQYYLKTHMPTCKNPNQKQMTTYEANESRLTTKIRWIVETTNGKLKTKFRANSKVQRNVTLQHSIDDWRISAAILNRFFNEYDSKPEDFIMATKMKAKLNVPNRLEHILSEHKLDRKRKDFTKLTANCVKDFPKISISDIHDNVTFGPYQIDQAKGYIKENFKQTDSSTIEIFKDKNKIFNDDQLVLLRSRIQSRHINSKQYFTYITYDKSIRDYNSIKDTICTCNPGLRTMGPCAHATSVVLYLSNYRYNSTKKSLVSTEDVYCNQVTSESSETESDTIIESNNDTSDTIIDSDSTIIDETTINDNSFSATLYPNLSSFSSTFE